MLGSVVRGGVTLAVVWWVRGGGGEGVRVSGKGRNARGEQGGGGVGVGIMVESKGHALHWAYVSQGQWCPCLSGSQCSFPFQV